jgi:hypothetical protein
MTRWIIAATGCLLVPRLAGQDGPTARVFCDPEDPANRCPGMDCRCSEDVLTIRFERSGGPILEVDDEPRLPIDATVVLETRSAGVQGWAYGVRHDGRALTIESVTIAGTDAGRHFERGFNNTNFKDITECGSTTDNSCSEPGAGFISAIILATTVPAEIPLGTSTLARMTYRLERGAASESGVLLELTERLAVRNSRPTRIVLTINGRSARPRALVDGLVFGSGNPFHRGDPDGDGRLSVADAALLLLFLFLAGPAPGCLDAGDADDDGRIDATDPVLILRWLFRGGSAPAPPGPPPAPCGPDPEGTGASLGCAAYAGC